MICIRCVPILWDVFLEDILSRKRESNMLAEPGRLPMIVDGNQMKTILF